MEVKIGVQNVSREIVMESSQSAEEVAATVSEGLTGRAVQLRDERGRLVVVPSAAVAYVEIGAEETRRVGFGGI